MADATTTIADKALEVLQGLINAATQAGDFIKGEVPLVIKELLTYNTALYIACIVFGLLIIGAGWTGFHYVNKARKAYLEKMRSHGYVDTSGYTFGAIVCAGFSSVIGVGFIVVNTIDLLKITLAPRVWLLEYASSLVHHS